MMIPEATSLIRLNVSRFAEGFSRENPEIAPRGSCLVIADQYETAEQSRLVGFVFFACGNDQLRLCYLSFEVTD
jgi:hypothetical protein